MNQINLIGRITRDLELRTTNSGKSVCEFDLAVNRVGQDTTDFINCTVWGTQAENLCKYQNKGSLIAVTGALRIDKYQNQDGENRYKTYVLANNIEYLSSKSSEEVSKPSQTDIIQAALNEEPTFNPDELILTDDDLPF